MAFVGCECDQVRVANCTERSARMTAVAVV